MADTSLERQVRLPAGGGWGAIRRLDAARRGLPYLGNDPLEMVELVTAAGVRWEGADLDEAEAWLARRPDDRLASGFVRWTSGGHAAGPGQRVVALRVASPATLYLRGQDEAAVEGMASRLVAVLEQRGASTRSGPLLDLPSLGDTAAAVKVVPTQRRSRTGHLLQHPITSGTIAQVLGGLILAGVLAAGALVFAHFR